ncbi:MAG TPA: AAA family ATPase [Patescibacteria group bacterium]|nr:AAA family ATPase [Patescibacteria group bacterium]
MALNNSDLNNLEDKINKTYLPEELRSQVNVKLNQLDKLSGTDAFLTEVDRLTSYVDWITSLPWQNRTKDILDLDYAKKVLDSHHYGLGEIKDRIFEYLSVMKLKGADTKDIARAPILCFVGLVGTGKTTIALSIAEAMGRKFARIPFGGMGDPLDLRGQSRLHPEAEPGKIIKALRTCGSKNPVILLDEIDRVTAEGRSSIMGVLVELLDPGQNSAFVDHYIDFPFDLSEVLFIATANNTTNIATAVLDRLEPLQMPSYTDQEKIMIARQYVLPHKMKEAGLTDQQLSFDENVWPQIVRPLGYDGGIRTLERTIDGVVRKVAREIVEGKSQSVTISPTNAKNYLPQ